MSTTGCKGWILLLLLLPTLAWAADPKPGDRLFRKSGVETISLELNEKAMVSLRAYPRGYVPGRVKVGNAEWLKVGVHLKGGTGSFRPIDGKPSFTLKFDYEAASQKLDGLTKIHLNNSVEDESYLHEMLGSELFMAAKIPAARVTHAVVELNGKRLGMYVLKEGWDFLWNNAGEMEGRLYEPAEGHDVGEALEEKQNANGTNRALLPMLVNALKAPAEERWQALKEVLDVDEFASFMAMEILLAHRDGYCLARNNFRIYENPETGRVMFLPHGMDQLFGTAPDEINTPMHGTVARAFVGTAEGRSLYRERIGILLSNVFDAPMLLRRVAAESSRLRPYLSNTERTSFDVEVADLEQRIGERKAQMCLAMGTSDKSTIRFTNGIAALSDWHVVDLPTHAQARERTMDGRAVLSIETAGATGASWQTRVKLGPGRYRFEALTKTKGVEPLSYGKRHGAVVRAGTARSAGQMGDADWRLLAVEFVLQAEQDVELGCELRASKGAAFFARDSLRLKRFSTQ